LRIHKREIFHQIPKMSNVFESPSETGGLPD
jgi:hypothetical protein